LQNCRKLIDDGWIGAPVAATALMMNHATSTGIRAGVLLQGGRRPDVRHGALNLTALVNLLGPVARVCGSAKRSFAERTILSEPLKGKKIDVEVPTHIAGVLDFAGGAVGTIITSFDVYSHTMPFIEIYGSEGTLRCPDPNTFGGPVFVKRGRAENWSEVPLLRAYPENSRGLGVADMAEAIAAGKPHRASAELTSHVLEIMHGFHDASASGTYYQVTSACARPAPRQDS
jgi:predicted dehydrogenase